MADTITAYPLQYPAGWARTPAADRRRSPFIKNSARRRVTTWEGIQSVLHELRLLQGARDIVVSTNLRLRNDGLPLSSQREPDDPGAAVYFSLNGEPRVLACDKWLTVGENLRAIALHVEAVRGQARWGVGTLEQAFRGYAALPPVTGEHWTSVLGLAPDAGTDEISRKYRQLVKDKNAHPDAGAETSETFVRLTLARDAALAEKRNGHS